MYPTKLDKTDIQTEVSSQFGFKMVNLTIQSDISSNKHLNEKYNF